MPAPKTEEAPEAAIPERLRQHSTSPIFSPARAAVNGGNRRLTPKDVRALGYEMTRQGWRPLTPGVVARLDEANERRTATPWRPPTRTIPGPSVLCAVCEASAEPSRVGTPTCSPLCVAVLWAWTGDSITETITYAGGELPGAPWPEKPVRRRPMPAEGQASVARALDQIGSCENVLERHGHRVRGRKASCVFHDEHTPSMSLFERGGKSRFRCYGCDAHGDSIDLEAHLAGESNSETVRRWGR